MEKSQNHSFNHEESLKKKSKTPSSSESNELKRKYSASPDTSEHRFKKVCIDSSYCRKSLLPELEKASSPKSTVNCEEKSHVSPPASPLSHKTEKISSSQLLDLLEKSSTAHKSPEPDEEADLLRLDEHEEKEIGSPIISDVWDNFDDVGLMPVTPGVYHDNTINKSPTKSVPKSPDTVITISSTTTSQMSKVSTLTSQESVTSSQTNNETVINALEDSFGAFEDGELSGLERAALNAYKKVMTPQRSETPIQKPGTSSNSDVTPMADYSIMESPVLQVNFYLVL
jgi:hypothetical protein